jgi:hypothetical protein
MAGSNQAPTVVDDTPTAPKPSLQNGLTHSKLTTATQLGGLFSGDRSLVNSEMAHVSADRLRPSLLSERAPVRAWIDAVEHRIPRSLWPFAGVILLYVVAAFVIPTNADVGISDDWTYALSVQNLVNQGRFEILSVSAATMVFQLFWGGLFAFLFGMTFGVLRISTLVITLLGGLAVFGMCRELGVKRQLSALGMAAYLFNPVLFSISYSFMTDPHYLALLAISSYFYVRGIRFGKQDDRYIIAGSIVAALGCLQRPHAALIPFALVLYLFASRRMNPDRAGVDLFLKIVAIPAATFVLYYAVIARGLPSQQGLFLDEARAAGWDEGSLLAKRIGILESVYAGFYLLPLALAAIPLLWKLTNLVRPRAWLVFGVFEAFMIGGVVAFWKDGRRMPYIPHFFGRSGPGSGDLRNARPPLFGPEVWNWFTVICVIAASIAVLAIVRAFAEPPSVERSGAIAFLVIGLFQAIGVVPQSLLFRNWIISLDRYLLPMTPFLVALFLWSVRDLRFPWLPAWTLTIAMAVFSIMGTRDILVFQNTVWGLGKWLNAQGVSDTRIDAGYAWDAYNLWEYGENAGITTPQTPDGTWWTDAYGKPTDSTYVIAGGQIPGYVAIAIQPYSAWLHESQQYLYVYRRDSYPGPP